MIRAVIFDLGGVLIKRPRNLLYSICSRKLGVSKEAFHKAHASAQKPFECGRISEREFLRRISKHLHVTMPKELIWFEAFKRCYVPKKRVISIIKLLKKNGYSVALLSNADSSAKKALAHHFIRLFDMTIFSCDVDSMKPEAKIYRLILKKLNIGPKEVVFIDDKEKNVKGAQAVGIHGIIFKDAFQLEKELKKLKIEF